MGMVVGGKADIVEGDATRANPGVEGSGAPTDMEHRLLVVVEGAIVAGRQLQFFAGVINVQVDLAGGAAYGFGEEFLIGRGGATPEQPLAILVLVLQQEADLQVGGQQLAEGEAGALAFGFQRVILKRCRQHSGDGQFRRADTLGASNHRVRTGSRYLPVFEAVAPVALAFVADAQFAGIEPEVAAAGPQPGAGSLVPSDIAEVEQTRKFLIAQSVIDAVKRGFVAQVLDAACDRA